MSTFRYCYKYVCKIILAVPGRRRTMAAAGGRADPAERLALTARREPGGRRGDGRMPWAAWAGRLFFFFF